MNKKTLYIAADVAGMYSEKRIARAASALSYYLTMTFFPMVICLYYLLGANSSKVREGLDIVYSVMTPETVETIEEFLRHVAMSKSPALLVAGITVLITSSSAAVRTLQATIGEMQGGQRFKGIIYFGFSILFSLLLLVAMYFSIIVIVTGRAVLNFVNDLLPLFDISSSWVYLRFLLLAGIMFLILWINYRMAVKRGESYRTYPGAILATVALVLMSAIFSLFIEGSTKYSLVYGSLASVILLMLWLYACCQIIYIGAAFNIAIRNEKLAEEKNLLTGGRIRIHEVRERYYEYKAIIGKTGCRLKLKKLSNPKAQNKKIRLKKKKDQKK